MAVRGTGLQLSPEVVNVNVSTTVLYKLHAYSNKPCSPVKLQVAVADLNRKPVSDVVSPRQIVDLQPWLPSASFLKMK